MPRISKATAFHEAGHVVARHFTGAGVFGVEACTDGTGEAFGSGKIFESSGSGQYAAWDALLITLAGPYAEARQSHQSRMSVILSHGYDDWQEAKIIISWLVENDFAANEQGAWRRGKIETANFLKSKWPKIERVATALRKQGKLTPDEVTGLCES